MARLALKLLGSYRLTLDGHSVDHIESDKARALLAYLIIENNRPHSREKLAGIFWAEQDEEHARGSLSQALYHLRGVLGDRPLTGILPSEPQTGVKELYLLVNPREIQFNPAGDFETDVGAFSAVISTCKAHDHPPNNICDDCLQRYQEATRLYRGDFLDGFYLPKSLAFEEWATVLREQLRLQVMGVLDSLVWAFERKCELEQALTYARRMVHLDDLSEMGNQHVMRLLAALGRRGEVLAQYSAFHQVLAMQLGAEPGVETRTLYTRLRNEEAETDMVNLPASLFPIVGRRQELDDLWTLMRDPKCRLICVLGPGGSGKTRLVLEATHRQRYHFRDGVYFVPLSALGAGSSLLSAIAEGLGFTFREFGEQKKQLMEYLRHKQVLLVLDSFETVVESAGLVAELLSAAQGCKALVTSRTRLNLSVEQVYPLIGMKVPPPDAEGEILDYSSMELFLDAARRASPGYSPDSMEGVVRICQLVEGMPLSLLLASTWVNNFSTHEIADRIRQSLDFLSVEWSDLPVRQRSLRATFEYSWDLLSATEQLILMNLSVFRNSFTTEAAHQVAGASPQVLHTLVGKSLVDNPADGKYRMHDLVRQYSADKLALAENDQERTVRQRHGEYHQEKMTGWSKLFKGPEKSASMAQADKEIEDIKAAWEWVAHSGEMDRLSQASEGLFLYYFLRYRFLEGEQACQLATKGITNTPLGEEHLNLEGFLLAWQVHFNRLLGKVEIARQLVNQGIEKLNQADAAGQDTRQGWALLWRERGYLAGTLTEQLDYFMRSAELFRELDDPWWQAGVLAWAGELTNRMGDRHLAIKLHQEAVALGRVAGEPHRLAYTLTMLAYDQLIVGSWEIGAKSMEEAAGWYRSVGDLGSHANADLHYGVALGWIGRYAEACDRLKSALDKLHQLGDRYYVVYATVGLGVIQMHSGNYPVAAVTLLEALEAACQNGIWREKAFCQAHLGCLALGQGESRQAQVSIQQAVTSFRQMGFAGELGMALGGLALAQFKSKLEKQAWASLQEALHLSVETHSRFTFLTLPAALVVLIIDAGKWEHALEVYTAVMTDPIVSNSRWFADMVGNRIELTREHLPEDAYQVAEARGREGTAFDVLARLEKEMSSWEQPISENQGIN